MRRKAEPTRSLTDKQRYLLNRIPARYSLDGFQSPTEPKEVVKARKLVDKWDKHIGVLRCRNDKRNEALIRKAQEAVYFADEVKALAIVQQIEKLLKSCEEK